MTSTNHAIEASNVAAFLTVEFLLLLTLGTRRFLHTVVAQKRAFGFARMLASCNTSSHSLRLPQHTPETNQFETRVLAENRLVHYLFQLPVEKQTLGSV